MIVVHQLTNVTQSLEFGVGSESSDCRIARLLIAWGADVNTLNASGQTPLHKAVTARKVDLVEMLIKSGACVTVSDGQGRSVLRCLIEAPRYSKFGHVRHSRILVDATPKEFALSARLEDHSKDVCKMFALLFMNGAQL